jgi:hypothetical protein
MPDLERTGARGFATDHREHDPNAHSVAAPVFLADDTIARWASRSPTRSTRQTSTRSPHPSSILPQRSPPRSTAPPTDIHGLTRALFGARYPRAGHVRSSAGG